MTSSIGLPTTFPPVSGLGWKTMFPLCDSFTYIHIINSNSLPDKNVSDEYAQTHISQKSHTFNSFLFILFNSAAFGSMAILKPLVQNDIFGKMNFGNIHGILAICFMLGSIAGPWIGSLIWSVGGYNLLIMLFFILAPTEGNLPQPYSLLLTIILNYTSFLSNS